MCPGSLRDLQRDARSIWAQRRTLARVSYEVCREDRGMRGWLAASAFGVLAVTDIF